MYLSDKFDSGNIESVDLSDPQNLQLAIKRDNQSDFFQWFHFRFEAELDKHYRFNIINAGQSAYPQAWKGYHVVASYDREQWFRIDSEFDGQQLSFGVLLEQNSIYFAYFTPYSYERHQDLIHGCLSDERVSLNTLGQTLDGRDMSLLTIGDAELAKNKVWVIARQHPGESMAEWFIEGMLARLLDQDNPLAITLLKDTVFYVVPNMNPDGSVRGHLRTNAVGTNLNREWQNPSMERSPEVFLVRQKMLELGGDLFLDIHGDEELPYNFVAGCEGIPSYDQRHQLLEDTFKQAFKAISPDFQDTHGYPKNKPGEANLNIAAAWLGEQFKTLSYTIEMPFKDNADLPDPDFGWSAERSMQLGADVLFAIKQTLAKM
ncbi:M14 family metallopeptidase [Agarivorans sp.]|uniref:M14 family metallopeptidase n=1 Tax=Agarivorans sp. TaxID=1872412 RepID=UPI003D031DC7